METRQQKLIREALEASGAATEAVQTPNRSLHQQALERTQGGYVPKTLTPHEWELYYERYGIPAEHRAGGAPSPTITERVNGVFEETGIEPVADSDHSPNRSLRQQAFERALEGHVPKTLTPYEWEAYYERYGVPESHRSAG